jgi:predicted small secreted protein
VVILKFDRFLAVLFSRKTVVLILAVVLAAFCLTSCELTFDDVVCFALTGCVTPETCTKMIWACGDCGSWEQTCEENGINCYCAGDACNDAFGCVWRSGLEDCRPSKICDSCGSKEEDEYEYESDGCDCSVLDIIDAILYN